ncbi:MAG: putative selenate ABC transporter substrate-binding protein [Dehalococcoidia bacterium]
MSVRNSRKVLLLITLLSALTLAACGGSGSSSETLYIGGIPDQDLALMEENFGLLADYLTDETGINVEYNAAADYAAIVTSFSLGDVPLVWFGGLTGIQARLATPGANAIVQRPLDADFYTVYITQPGSGIETLEDVRGKRLTFGSESSTSGHVMPRSFLLEAGIDPDTDLDGPPNYSGSHDTTIRLVETGAFEVGGVNEAIWEDRVERGEVDTDAVQVFHRAGPSYNYHWVVRPDIDDQFGAGTAQALEEALLNMHEDTEDERVEQVLAFFTTDRFIPTENGNYDSLEATARSIGLIE